MPNNFQIIEEGDHVICAISGKISLKDLNYWNVDLQEAYYSYREASKKEKWIRATSLFLFPSIMCPNPLTWIFYYHLL